MELQRLSLVLCLLTFDAKKRVQTNDPCLLSLNDGEK